MLTDLVEVAVKAILYTAGGALLAIGLLFFAAHVYDTWDAPEYPYSGFCPDFPTWEAPENTLPPTDGHTTCHGDDLTSDL